jgi:uncharacterized alkaline shock family protein YloU
MKIYGLVGKSGTGKSYQAMNVAKEKNIDCIIDDGLLISGSSILAGKSAKRQSTKVGAIKTALFTDQVHRDAVVLKIKERHPDSILVLGTSQGMIRKIIARLNLPDASEVILIEHIATEQEIETAIKQRKELGKHVIPVPTFQLKKHFSGYLIDPLRIFKGWGTKHNDGEKSVVRPTFSYLGDFTISDKVISDIVACVAEETVGVSSVLRVQVTSEESGITLQVLTLMNFSVNVIEAAKHFQKSIAEMVERMTAFNILSVNIEVRGLK